MSSLIKKYISKENENFEIEAVLYDGSKKSKSAIEELGIRKFSKHGLDIERTSTLSNGMFLIMTIDGEKVVYVGDYVVKNEYTGLYPCKPDIFLASYSEKKW